MNRDTASFVECICQYPTRNKTAPCTAFSPSCWSLTLISSQSGSAQCSQHGCMQKYAVLHGVRFEMDAEIWTVVQKAFQAIPAKEFEKTMTQK